MKIKKILSPVDFSENSLNALQYAAAFARATDAGIFILHVTDPDTLEQELKGNLSPEHMINLLKESDYLKGIKTHVILEKGNVTSVILDESYKNDIDLVVMGTQGAGNMTRELIGTNTTHVVGKSNCMVLAVPAKATYQSIKKIVFAVDLEHRADQIIEEVIAMLKPQNTAIRLAYVGEDKEQEFERELSVFTAGLRSKTGYEKIDCEVIHSEAFPESLEKYAFDEGADMVVMVTHHRGVFEAIFDPSQTKMYAYHTNIPLLAIPHHKTPVYFF